MRVAVAAPAGNVGSKLVPALLEKGAEQVLLCRSPEKVSKLTGPKVQARPGDLIDVRYLREATEGVDALFWVSPPNMGAADFRGYQRQLASNVAAVISANAIPRVVNLSSVGAQHAAGTGPVAGLHGVEEAIDETGVHVVHLRPAFFMENYLMQLEPMKSMGSVFMPVSGTVELPMVATKDIAEVSTRWLIDDGWTGRRVVGIHGPEDVSFDRAASILGEAIGKQVTHVKASSEQARETMLAMGLGESAVDVMLEFYEGFENGLMNSSEARTEETTTPTTLRAFAREVIRPLVGE